MIKAVSFCKMVAVLVLVALPVMDARANSLLISPNPNPGQKFPVQGDCRSNGIDPANPNIDLTRSTWACSGASGQMVRIFYREGPEECVYIDNFNNDNNQRSAFFVPLQTSDEWTAFASNLPGGVRLRYGCQGIILTDPCGNRFALPDSQASDNAGDVISITTSGGAYKADYSCPLTVNGSSLSESGGCGAWVKTKETGVCAQSVAPRGGNTIPTTPGTTPGNGSNGVPSSPTTSIPRGETPGPVINIGPNGPTTSNPTGETPGPVINVGPTGPTTSNPGGETPGPVINIQ